MLTRQISIHYQHKPKDTMVQKEAASSSLIATSVVQAFSNQRESVISLYSYLLGFTICFFLTSSFLFSTLTITLHAVLVYITVKEITLLKYHLPTVPVFSSLAHGFFTQLERLQPAHWAVAKRAYFLGIISGFGRYLYLNSDSLDNFGLWLTVLSFFHFSEYFFTSISNPKNLGIKSFLLDHSREYHLAFMIAFIEYFFERWLFPSYKIGTSISWLNFIGLFMCTFGECLRKLAMVTAGTNFNHLVEYHHRQEHVLITNGVYSICRHPSYTGWFIWSIGTQLVLGNPICTVFYALASWAFFKDRIPDEEQTLIEKFGHQYINYRQQVPLGLPFISV